MNPDTRHYQRRSLIERAPSTRTRTLTSIAAVGSLTLLVAIAPIASSSARSERSHRADRAPLSWLARRTTGPRLPFMYVLHRRAGASRHAPRPRLFRSGTSAAATTVRSRLASAATLTVCPSGCAFAELAPAIRAASPGDTIRVAAGTYSGGFAIDKSLRLVGAGAQATTIDGGGPVITVGAFGAASEPTVSISGFKITGGVTHSSPESTPFYGQDGVFAVGGGVEIPPNADFSGGATVTITNSVITGNRVAPTTAIDSTLPCPPDITITCISGDLPFAQAGGGGIDNWGTLTLAHTTVSDNRVGSAAGLSSVASDADGGAILNWLGPLTITDSLISGNQASAAAPNGRFADTGGIFLEGGSLTMSNGSVTNNEASLSATLPSDVPFGTLAVAGGLHLSSNVPTATISNSTISGNSATMTNAVGDSNAFSGGVHVDVGVQFALSNSTVSDNSVAATTLPGSSGNAAGDSAAGEMHGTITNTRLTGNRVSVSSVAGGANAAAGTTIFFGSISNSLVRGNHVQASSPAGFASAAGGGLMADQGGMTLRNTTVSDNTADVAGQSALAQGGGIFDAPIPNGPPGGPLTLQNSSITRNTLTGSAGAALQGGGLYIQSEQLTMTNSVIVQNAPDQCFGC